MKSGLPGWNALICFVLKAIDVSRNFTDSKCRIYRVSPWMLRSLSCCLYLYSIASLMTWTVHLILQLDHSASKQPCLVMAAFYSTIKRFSRYWRIQLFILFMYFVTSFQQFCKQVGFTLPSLSLDSLMKVILRRVLQLQQIFVNSFFCTSTAFILACLCEL